MAISVSDQKINDFLARLSAEGYIPEWEFALAGGGGDDGGYEQLFALPYTQYQKEHWGQGGYFGHDPDRYLTSQGLLTGQFEGAIPLTEDQARTDPRFAKDWGVWQEHLGNLQDPNRDSWSPFGDQFMGALAALGLATGGAALAGGFAAPGAAGAGALGAADVGGSIAPIAATPVLTAPAGAIPTAAELAAGVGGVGALGGGGAAALGGGGAAGAIPAAAAGGGTLATLADLAPLLGPLISGGTSLIGGAIGSGAARDAATTQADAAREANALLAAIHAQNRADQEPYRQAGYQALGQLQGLVQQPFQLPSYQATPALDPSGYAVDPSAFGFQSPVGAMRAADWQYTPPAALSAAQYGFTPPSGQDLLAQDPGYAFRLEEGRKALEASAAARGGLLSGATGKALTQFGQDLASNEYGNAYNRAFGRHQYNTGLALTENEQNANRGFAAQQFNAGLARQENQDIYNRALTENNQWWERALTGGNLNYERARQANADTATRNFQQYQANLGAQLGQRQQAYNELAGLSGTGQAANTLLANLGQTLGNAQAGNITSAGAANAAGGIGAANAWSNALGGIGSAATSYLNNSMLQQQQQQQNDLMRQLLGVRTR